MASLKDNKLTYEGTTWELDLATVHNWISELAPWLLVGAMGYILYKIITDRKCPKEKRQDVITRKDFEDYKKHMDEEIKEFKDENSRDHEKMRDNFNRLFKSIEELKENVGRLLGRTEK